MKSVEDLLTMNTSEIKEYLEGKTFLGDVEANLLIINLLIQLVETKEAPKPVKKRTTKKKG